MVTFQHCWHSANLQKWTTWSKKNKEQTWCSEDKRCNTSGIGKSQRCGFKFKVQRFWRVWETMFQISELLGYLRMCSATQATSIVVSNLHPEAALSHKYSVFCCLWQWWERKYLWAHACPVSRSDARHCFLSLIVNHQNLHKKKSELSYNMNINSSQQCGCIKLLLCLHKDNRRAGTWPSPGLTWD